MKSYIGSSINITRRLYTHKKLLTDKKHWIPYFQNSWNKYGESAFEFHVIEYCPKEKLIEREQFYLDIFQTVKYGFNLNPIAASMLGYKHSEKTCAKMLEIQRKRFSNPVFREKHKQMICSDKWKESVIKGITAETKLLQSQKQKQRCNCVGERAEMSKRAKASWQNPEIRQKMITALNKPEVIMSRSERMKRLWNTPEMKKLLSERGKRQFVDPEARRRMSIFKKEQCSNPEFRLKQSIRNVKFSKEEVRKIRILLALKVTPGSLSGMFKCGMATISNIKRNKILAYKKVA